MTVEQTAFGKMPNGQSVSLFTCRNTDGLVLKMTDFGAIVVSMETPDRNGTLENINVGFEDLASYFQKHPHFGATIGRYGNRIGAGRFTLDGKTYNLARNNGPNHLHGGEKGFDVQLWNASQVQSDGGSGIRFSYLSVDAEENYPGNLSVVVQYTLTNDNELKIAYEATTDVATVVNLTNHCYWNLSAVGSGKITDHLLTISADKYLAVDETLIPTGEMIDVAGTVFDFRHETRIGEGIADTGLTPPGYDHCFVLRGQGGSLQLAAKVRDPTSGRVMEVLTTQPGMQFYTGNFLAGQAAQAGVNQHEAFCLETQHYPDSPNRPEFPSTVLRPGDTYRQLTVHRFTVQ